MPKKSSDTRRKRGGDRKKSPYRVFISHASLDKFLAVTVCEKLESIGVATFLDDRDINGGDSIPETIKRNLIGCDELLVLLTPQSVHRQWVLIEIGAAWGANQRIVPLLYGLEAEQIPAIIGDRKGFHLNELDKYLSDLSLRIRKP